MEFYVKETKPYDKRRKDSLITNLVISLIIFFIVFNNSDQYYGTIISVFVFIIQHYKSNRWNRFFITKIIFSDGITTVIYSDKNEKKELSDLKTTIRFEKKIAFSKIKNPYLAVFYKDDLIIKQFVVPDWTEKKIDEIIFLSSENKL